MSSKKLNAVLHSMINDKVNNFIKMREIMRKCKRTDTDIHELLATLLPKAREKSLAEI